MKESRRRFEAGEYRARQEKTRVEMASRGLDLLIVYDPSNMCWLTGFDGWSFYTHQCVVIGTEGELFWFGRIIDAATAKLTTDLEEKDICIYPDHYVQSPDFHPMERLADILKEKHLDNQSIGVEKDNYYFSARSMETLSINLPGARFIDATALVNWQRAVKSPQELIYMRGAGRVVEKIYQRVSEVAEPGMRKNELVAEILHAGTVGTDDYYGDYGAIVPLVGAGSEASACHMTWDGETLEDNSAISFELTGVHARYHCPCSRTYYFGEPPRKFRDIEKVILELIDLTLDKFRPGNSCGDVAETFFSGLKRHGYEKVNRVGYPIGLSYPPDWGERTMSLRPTDKTELEEGMCFHFMPGIWMDDWGFSMTESVAVTASGAECLSNVPRKLIAK